MLFSLFVSETEEFELISTKPLDCGPGDLERPPLKHEASSNIRNFSRMFCSIFKSTGCRPMGTSIFIRNWPSNG